MIRPFLPFLGIAIFLLEAIASAQQAPINSNERNFFEFYLTKIADPDVPAKELADREASLARRWGLNETETQWLHSSALEFRDKITSLRSAAQPLRNRGNVLSSGEQALVQNLIAERRSHVQSIVSRFLSMVRPEVAALARAQANWNLGRETGGSR